MGKRLPEAIVSAIAVTVVLLGARTTAQSGQGSAAAARNPTPANMPLATLQDMFVRFPLPAGQEAYADIDGRRMHDLVVEQANISRKYRDAGHPKFWGRIIGTSADTDDVAWMTAKFKAAGLADVHAQPFDLVPQWFPQSWDVSVTAAGKTIALESAQPDYGAAGTDAEGLDLDAVYVGLGSEADFAGRDVKGKAVFVFSMLGAPSEGAVRRADAKGAAAILEVNMLPGNARYQAYPSGTKAPAFTVGHDDGVAVRDLIATMPAGQSARVKVKLDVRRVPNLKTAQIWGTLPGATDETIYIFAHRDGWFDASGDNAGGVASMLALAEHFAQIPQAQRKRTMIFVALDGHHNSGEGSAVGNKWLAEHRQKLFANTALAINIEHPSTVQTQSRPRYYNANEIVWGNTYMPQQWYAGGPSRPELQNIATSAFRLFGATMDLYPSPVPPASDMSSFYRFLPGIDTSEFHHYFHTDLETPQTVPWTGLEASTRAYAKIIDEVNKLPLSTFQRPEEPAGTQPAQPLLQWPLPPDGQAYADIDGRRLHTLVVDQAAISRRYRDQGHPQFWGRITGTSSDAESAQWLAGHFKRIGLTDVRIQPIDLPPQWMPQSWTITASSGATTLQLDRSATPAYGTPGTSGEGIDADAVWVGTASEADFAGRDVRGKAVFMFSMPLPGSMNNTSTLEGGPKRAEEKGAAAVFEVIALPGNMRNVLYPARVNVPVFALGMEDGYAMRDLIGKSAGRPPRVHIRLDVRQVPNEKSSLVWGTLPGATDETIYVMAHRDGWFDAATDNASGVATMIGLAEHFSKMPRERRRRTMVFVGLDGHHNDSGGVGRMWMADHRDQLFAKTALAINAEHTSTIQTYFYGEKIRRTNTYTAQLWYAGGPTRPKLQDLAVRAFQEFGVPIYTEPEQAPPPGDLGRFFRFVPGVDAGDFNMYFHTDDETPETVPWTGLEASTRAYARIIDGVNELDLTDLQRPPESER